MSELHVAGGNNRRERGSKLSGSSEGCRESGESCLEMRQHTGKVSSRHLMFFFFPPRDITVVCSTFLYEAAVQPMNAALSRKRPTLEIHRCYSSSRQMTNETLAAAELFICVCGHNKGCGCWKSWFTVAFTQLHVGILLSRAWELWSLKLLLCLSCAGFVFLLVRRMQTKLQRMETNVFTYYL